MSSFSIALPFQWLVGPHSGDGRVKGFLPFAATMLELSKMTGYWDRSHSGIQFRRLDRRLCASRRVKGNGVVPVPAYPPRLTKRNSLLLLTIEVRLYQSHNFPVAPNEPTKRR